MRAQGHGAAHWVMIDKADEFYPFLYEFGARY